MAGNYIDSEYKGFFAEFYDILHSNMNDVPYYIEFAKNYGPSILELGSGTGRILIPVARAGYKITGLEIHREMLDICKKKLENEPDDVKNRVELACGNMTDFKLGKKFDLIFCACNTFCHLTSMEDVKKTLLCVKEHLNDSGVFILDNSIPDVESMVDANNKEETFEFIHPVSGRKILDKFKASYDFVNQLEYDQIVLEECESDKLVRSAESKEKITYFFSREARTFLELCGFHIFKEMGSFKGGPITEKSREMIFLCRKA